MLLIKNCKVLIDGNFAEKNILINDEGKIEKISSLIKSAEEVYDAKGNYAIPGAIDMHVHCREPGMTQKEDFKSATMAASAGGITTIVDMPNTIPPTTTLKLLEEKRKIASEKCIVNYGFYLGATSSNISEIRSARNIAGVKVYMGSSTGSLLVADDQPLNDIFGSGQRISVHAENEAMIRGNTERLKGSKDPSIHGRIRNNIAAAFEVERAINLAKKNKTRLHICHVSTAEEVDIIQKNRNLLLSCEVTPHHLFLDATKTSGNFGKVNPPLRGKMDIAALWDAVLSGTIDMIATDHAPHLIEEKELDYWSAPSGVPGLETMLPLMLDAVNKNRISLQRLTELTSFNPASRFKIDGKGSILAGFDADITIVDLKKEKTIKNDELFTKCKWSPFNGWRLKGSIAATFVNGELVYDGNSIVGKSGMEVEFS